MIELLYGDSFVEAVKRDYSFHHMRKREVWKYVVILWNFEVLVAVETGHTGQHVPMTQKNAFWRACCSTCVRKSIDIIIDRLDFIQIYVDPFSLLNKFTIGNEFEVHLLDFFLSLLL